MTDPSGPPGYDPVLGGDGRPRGLIALASLVVVSIGLLTAGALLLNDRHDDRSDDRTGARSEVPAVEPLSDMLALGCNVELLVVEAFRPAGGLAAATAAAADLSEQSEFDVSVVDTADTGAYSTGGERIWVEWDDVASQQSQLPEGARLNEGVLSTISIDVSPTALYGPMRWVYADPALSEDQLTRELRRTVGQLLVGRADLITTMSDTDFDEVTDRDVINHTDEPPYDLAAVRSAGRRCSDVVTTTTPGPVLTATVPAAPAEAPAEAIRSEPATWATCELWVSIGADPGSSERTTTEAVIADLDEQSGYTLSVSAEYSLDDEIHISFLGAEDTETMTSIDHRGGVAFKSNLHVDPTLTGDELERELAGALSQVLSGHANTMLPFAEDSDELLPWSPDDPWMGMRRADVGPDALSDAAERCGGR